jgi:hypothetical protein
MTVDANRLRDSIKALAKKARGGDTNAMEALQRFVQDSKNLRIVAARKDPAAFLSYVMRDEESGDPISLAPYHRRLQSFISEHNYAGVLGHVECGKSMNVTVGRVAYEVGKNPNLRVGILMKTQDKAKPSIRLLAHYLTKSREYKEVFPHIRKDKNGPWNTTELTVNRSSPIQQPTVQALGLGSDITGKRLDLVIMDDVLTGMNTLSPTARRAVLDWIIGTLVSRLTRNGRIWFITNAWHPEDAFHVLTRPQIAGGYGWHKIVLPVMGPVVVDGKEEVFAKPGESNWPGRWTPEYIALKTRLFGGPKHPETARQLYCQARSDDAARFKQEWIDLALQAGKGIYGDALSLQKHDPPPGWRNFTGMDLGVKKHMGADLTAQFHLGVRPDGKIQVYGIESGRFDGPDIVRRAFDGHKRFHSTTFVEDNGAQDFIRQFAKDPAVAAALGRGVDADRFPVYPFNTRGSGGIGNKHSPQFGIESIGAEMATGRWIIPCIEKCSEDGAYTHLEVHPEIESWIQDMLYYDPMGHPGDRLMASWFAHCGARRRTIGWRVGVAGDPDETTKHWIDAEREERERIAALSAEERRVQQQERQKQQQQAQIDSAWGDLEW